MDVMVYLCSTMLDPVRCAVWKKYYSEVFFFLIPIFLVKQSAAIFIQEEEIDFFTTYNFRSYFIHCKIIFSLSASLRHKI